MRDMFSGNPDKERTHLSHLPYELARRGFVELSSRALLEEFVHLASRGKLQDHVDFGLIVKVSEESQYVDMPGKTNSSKNHWIEIRTLLEMRLDLNFSAKLMFYGGLL